MWGHTCLRDYNKPFETNLQSLDEVFSFYGDGTMYRTLKIGTNNVMHMHFYDSEF